MVNFIGKHEDLALFSEGDNLVAVDISRNLVEDFSQIELSKLSLKATKTKSNLDPVVEELANAALTSVMAEEPVTASGKSSMYTVPGGVQKEAKKGLEWRKEHDRGGTRVGYNTARRLAKGGQIGIEKIRHIAKYFPRHEVDKKAKGYEYGEDGFPSAGRIAWALWGGDAGQRWASAIVEREDKKEAKTASGYGEYHSDNEYDADLNAFKMAHELDMNVGPEFMARIRLDGSGIDRLYKIDIDGRVYIWDDCAWDDLGHVDGDIYFYDRTLDEPYDMVEKTHVMIDPSSAVVISAFIQERPFTPVLLEEIDPLETNLMNENLVEEDFEMIDRVMTAAGEPTDPESVTDQDGDYTEEERSAKAQNQPRDAGGKFVSAGSRTVVGGDKQRGSGTITSVNSKTGKVKVRLDSGKEIEVGAEYTQAEEDVEGPRRVPKVDVPLDTSGILAEPRSVGTGPKAQLPGTMAPMAPEDFQKVINDWDGFVKSQRESYKLHSDTDPAISRVTDGEKKTAPGLRDYDKDYMKKRYGKNFAIIAAAQTPKNSDIPAKYLAIVSPDDLGAVMDLVAIVPETPESTTPVLYERKEGKWVRNDQIMSDLKSATPPPVVELDDEEVLKDTLKQVDEASPVTASAELLEFWEKVVDPLLAAGGLDRNRGGAEKLRRYWTRGVGGAKIMWNTPGDWTRCVRYLSKYMGPRAKGYCQLRHKEMTGVYTGSKRNVGKKSPLSASGMFKSEEAFEAAVVAKSELRARAEDARIKIGLVAGASKKGHGAKFYIPLVIPEEAESGDGRKFKKEAIGIRELPIPLLWQIKTGSGHDGSVVVGRIDYMERTENGIGNAYGVFDTGPYGREAERMVKHGFLKGVSADLDQFEAKEEKSENAEDDEMGKDKLVINKARVMAATIVAKPAFQECSISIQETGDQEDDVTPKDGLYEESIEEFSDVEPITASGYLESDIPVTPPHEWFQNPQLTKPTPLTVDPSGRIYGHIAAWHVSHIGLPRSTKPPRSRSKYAYFHTGVVHTDAGKDIPVGQLTLAGGHAPLNANAAAAAKHYDDTASAIADVHAGEDEFGIWVSGSLRPDIEESQVRALRASAPSGDWRPIDGALELVAVCQVNVPGFPVARAMVASGQVLALVAAGASFFAVMKSEAVTALSSRADKLAELANNAPDLHARASKHRDRLAKFSKADIASFKIAKMRNRINELSNLDGAEFKDYSEDTRDKYADKGFALPDGSFPIADVEDLKDAIQAHGRAKDIEKAKKHIVKRARALGKEDLIPEEWNSSGAEAAAARVASMREKITGAFEAITASTEFADEEPTEKDLEELERAKEDAEEQQEQEEADLKKAKGRGGEFDPEEGRTKYISGVDQPRDAKGKYRKVLARLKQDLGTAGLQKALKKVEEAENMDFAGNYVESAAASSDLLGLLDRLDAKALNPEALENVRLTAAELGKTIANLPLPFGKDAEKIKYSDLPSGLKDLIEGMVTRVESKIGKEDAAVATDKLKSYMSGGDLFSQGEVQSEMSKMLRLLN